MFALCIRKNTTQNTLLNNSQHNIPSPSVTLFHAGRWENKILKSGLKQLGEGTQLCPVPWVFSGARLCFRIGRKFKTPPTNSTSPLYQGTSKNHERCPTYCILTREGRERNGGGGLKIERRGRWSKAGASLLAAFPVAIQQTAMHNRHGASTCRWL